MALMKIPEANQRCPDCGQAFLCGIANDAPCWCATGFAPLMPLTDPASGCYCRECLEKRITARQTAARDSII
jgi:ribosomal protein L34E